jgi:hypothetical protein
MGIIVPRPAMRRREARRIKSALERHLEIMFILELGGVSHTFSSEIAFNIVTTSKARKAIWHRHD